MKKGFRSLPSRILAAVLTAGMIVSSSDLDYVRFILPEKENVSKVEAAQGDEKISLNDKNLQTAMNVIVNYYERHKSVESLKGANLLDKKNYGSYMNDIDVNSANTYTGVVDLSGCEGIKDLSGMKVFKGMTEINVSKYIGNTIPEEAFEDCLSLGKVIISDKVVNIEKDAFNNCNSLSTIEVSGADNNAEETLNLYNIRNIGEHAFDSANQFKYVTFNDKAYDLKIGANAFLSCDNLTKITLPSTNAANLSEAVFAECSKLEEVELSDELKGIPNNFFLYCNLSKMKKFPKNLETIGIDAFACTNLLYPDLSGCDNLRLIDQGAFQGIGYSFDETHREFKLPATLSGDGDIKGSTGIKRLAFALSSLYKINIPKGITTIQDSTFEGCIYLTDVTIADGSELKTIGKWAFRRCDRLQNTGFISSLQSLTTIDDYAFSECYSLEKDAKGFIQDEYGVYKVVSGLESVVLPASLKKIGKFAFANNYNLKTVSMKDSITEIPEWAFALHADTKHFEENFRVSGFTDVQNNSLNWKLLGYASQLDTVTLSKNLTSIGDNAFRYNPYLKSVTYNDVEVPQKLTLELPKSVVSIGNYAFADCARWQVDVDANKDKVIDHTDYKMDGLMKVDLKDLKLNKFGTSVFENDYMLSTAILPSDLKVIPSRLFYDCGNRIDKTEDKKKVIVGFYGLQDVTFPDNVEVISSSAFEGCENFVYKVDEEEQLNGKDANAKDIKLNPLPASLTEIGDRAFFGCQKIGKIALNRNLTTIGKEAFRECSIIYMNPEDTKVPNYKFEDGYGLTSVSFIPASNLNQIGDNAFYQSAIDMADLSANLQMVNIPSGLFMNCYNLKSSILPDTSTKVGSKVFSTDIRLKSVKLPSIAEVNSDIFSGIGYIADRDYKEALSPIYGDFDMISITLASQSGKSTIKVPIGKSLKLDFIKSNNSKYNHYTDRQRFGEKILDEEEKFITLDSKDNGDIYLVGEFETPDTSELSITNKIEFDEIKDVLNNKTGTLQKTFAKDYYLTVSEQYAEELQIMGIVKGAEVQKSEDGSDVIYLSSDLINDNNDKNKATIYASVLPVPITKAPVWGSEDPDIISVDDIDAADENVIETVNKGSKSEAVIHVKKFGTTKIWVAAKAGDVQKKKKEVTVKVVYPITGIQTSVESLEAAANNDKYQLEVGASDKINVTPSYSDAANESDDASKANYYYESTDPSVAAVDRDTGDITANNKTGSTNIRIFDDTGKELKTIKIEVVEAGKLEPNLIKIIPKDINIYENESTTATATIFPDGVPDENKGITWSVKDNNIAEIEENANGSVTVKGKSLGSTKLIAKSVYNNVSAEIDVNVAVAATSITFQGPDVQLAVGSTVKIPTTTKAEEKLSFFYEPENAKKDTITWEIGDESIAQFVNSKDNVIIEKGVPEIKGIKQGVTTLTAKTGNGLKAELNISVYNEITEFSVPEKKSVHIGDTFKLEVSKTPADSSEKFTFASSKDEIATVDENGVVKGVSEGTATITVSRANGKKVSCAVSVVEKVSQITILDGALEIGVDKTYKIGRASDDEKAKTGYRLTPKSSDELTWSTSNSAVASVEFSKGTVTIKGVAPGTATITATSLSGQTAAINVTVVSSTNEIKFTEESIKVAINTQAALTLVRDPADSSETVEYTTSDEKKATVDDNGVVTGVEKGEVTITATTKVSKKSAKIKVIITVPATKIQAVTNYASEKKIYLVKGNTYKLKYKILPEESTDKVTFTSNKKKIAPISEDGTITAKKKGNATITIKTESGKTAKVKVYVVNKEKNAKKIKIKTASIKVGKTVKLKYTVTAATTTNSVGYSVDKPEIAKIDEFGYITGLKKGKVKVTITMSNGKAKTKTIKVKK